MSLITVAGCGGGGATPPATQPVNAPGPSTAPAPSVAPTVYAAVYDVSTFGARGDGSTDDAPAIQKALSAACAASSVSSEIEVFVPSGVYRVDSRIDFSAGCAHVHIVGAGQNAAIIAPSALMTGVSDSKSTVFAALNAPGSYGSNLSLENIAIDGSNEPAVQPHGNAAGVLFSGVNAAWVKNVTIKNMPGFGVIDNTPCPPGTCPAASDGGVTDSTFANNGRGSLGDYQNQPTDTIGGGNISGFLFERNTILLPNGSAIDHVAPVNCTYSYNKISGVGNAATSGGAGYIMSDSGAVNNRYEYNTFENAGGIALDSGPAGVPKDNVINGNRIDGYATLPYDGGTPPVPPNGGSARNAGRWPVQVTITSQTSGSATVSINGVPVPYLGGAENTFLLQPGDVVNLSYSGDLQWAWLAVPNATSPAIALVSDGSSPQPLTGNVIKNNTISNVARAGIYIQYGMQISISGNSITNPGQVMASAGLVLDSANAATGCSHCMATGNTIVDTRSPKSILSDVAASNSLGNNVITGNTLQAQTQAGVLSATGWSSTDVTQPNTVVQ